MNQSRRTLLKIGGAALAMIPVVALAAKNDGMRASMKYVDKSTDPAKVCTNCVQFVPGGAKGGCKLFPGDTEVSPNGSCVAFAKKP